MQCEYRVIQNESTLLEINEAEFISPQQILENPAKYEPISSEDGKKLKINLIKIKLNIMNIEDGSETLEHVHVELLNSLTYVNDLLNRIKLTTIEILNKISMIRIFISLSMGEFEDLRSISLSILATLTDYIPNIHNDLIQYSFVESIRFNLESPFFNGQKHVFRWIQNFLIHYHHLSETFFENIPLELIYESSNRYLSEISGKQDATKIEKKICQSMFFLIASCNLNCDQVSICIHFLKQFNESDTQLGGMQFVLSGIHKILSNKNYPKEFLCQEVDELHFHDLLNFFCRKEKNNRKKALSFCILGDIYELGFNDNDLVLVLLNCSLNEENTVWFNHSIIKSLRRILNCCRDELLVEICDVCMSLIEISDAPNFKIRKEIFICIGIFINRINYQKLLNFFNENTIELLFSTLQVHTDEDILRLMIEGIFRLVAAAEHFGEESHLYSLVKNCEAVDCLQALSSYDGLSQELSGRILELCNYFNL